jgi:hypothetical protein
MRYSWRHHCRQELGTQIERWGLRDAGFAYNIVAVFGSQSTGKSKILLVMRMTLVVLRLVG